MVANANLTKSKNQQQIEDIQKIANAQKQQIADALAANFGSEWRENATAVELYAQALAKSNEQMKLLTEATKENQAKSKEFSTGWQQAMNQFIDDSSNGATLGKQMFTGMTDGVVKAIDSMVSHGKYSFKDLFASLLMDLMNQQLKQAMVGIFGLLGNKQASSSALGGGMGDCLGAI